MPSLTTRSAIGDRVCDMVLGNLGRIVDLVPSSRFSGEKTYMIAWETGAMGGGWTDGDLFTDWKG